MNWKNRLDKARAWFRGARLWIFGGILILVVLGIPLLPSSVWAAAASFSYFDAERLERLKPLGQIIAAVVVLVGLILCQKISCSAWSSNQTRQNRMARAR